MCFFSFSFLFSLSLFLSHFSFFNFFACRYHKIQIQNKNQPLLISIQKRKRPGTAEKEEHIIYLIPELCHLTGMTDEMAQHNNLRLIQSHTLIDPRSRINQIAKFTQNFVTHPEPSRLPPQLQKINEVSGKQKNRSKTLTEETNDLT